MADFRIYCDGAASMFKNNNNCYIRGNGGWAFALYEDGNLIESFSGGEKYTTNQRMELTAILNAMERYTEGTIVSDSAYCINMLSPNGWIYSWAKNGWTRGKKHEPIENLDLIQKIYELLKKGKYSFEKVKGHSNSEENNFVDRLAVEAKEGVIN